VRFGADIHTVSVIASGSGATEIGAHDARLLGTDGGDIEVHVRVGDDVAAGIREEAADLGSCLVCMSTHGRGRVEEAVAGSVARALVASARQPMVTVGPPCVAGDRDGPEPLSAGDVIACVDGSGASEVVLPVAAAWASALGMRLTIVTVAEPSPPPLRAGATWHRHHGPQADVEDYLQGLRDQWSGAVPSVRTDAIYDPLSPAEGVRTYLTGHAPALLAMSTHGREGVSALVLGSVATSIIHVSTVPVLLVPLR
jgi:nucleotide-binding universal stress UspA family protein